MPVTMVKRKKIAVVIGGQVLSYSPSMLNIIGLLAGKYNLHLYANCPIENVPLENADGIIRRVFFAGTISMAEWLKKLFNLRQFVGLLWARVKWILAKPFYRLINYDFVLSIDPQAYLFARNFFRTKKTYYYSLELYLKKDRWLVPGFADLDLNSLNGFIIQSPERDQIFREEYGISGKVGSLHVPVTYRYQEVKAKGDFLRSKFNIDHDNKVALYIGGILPENEISLLISAFGDIADWVLVLHGYHDPAYRKELDNLITERQLQNIFFNDMFFDHPDQLNSMIASADLGIAWYEGGAANFETAGFSSGKISAYFQAGVPVLTNNYPSFKEAVEKTEAGICISDFSELPSALKKVREHGLNYSVNARTEFEKRYCFELYENSILEFLN